MLATVKDVSALRRAETLARQTQDLLLEAERLSGTGSWEWDLNTNRVRWSPELYRQYGVTKEELPDPTADDGLTLVASDDLPAVKAYVKATLAGEKPGPVTYRIDLRDGTRKHMRAEGEVVCGSDGRAVRMFGFVRDVTAQVQAAEHIGIWESVYETGDIGIMITDRRTSRIVRANRAFARMHGYEPEELVGVSADDLVMPSELGMVHENRQKIARVGGRIVFELESRHRDGHAVSVEVEGSHVDNEAAGTYYRVSLVRDITQRRAAARAMTEARQKLEALSRQLIELQERERRTLAQDLHDHIGQMLTALKLQLQMLREARVDEQRIARIDEATSLVEQTIDTTRDLSLALRPPMLDELGLVPAARWYTQQFANQTQIELDVAFAKGASRGDEQVETACFRILQEALTNVARHADAASVGVRLGSDAGALTLRVWDDGRGFDPDVATAEHLGLLGMEERAQLAGGVFELQTAPGQGTKITVRFPAAGGAASAG